MRDRFSPLAPRADGEAWFPKRLRLCAGRIGELMSRLGISPRFALVRIRLTAQEDVLPQAAKNEVLAAHVTQEYSVFFLSEKSSVSFI